MARRNNNGTVQPVAVFIRRLLLAWLFAATVEYALCGGQLHDAGVLAGMSFLRTMIVTFCILLGLILFGKLLGNTSERWAMAGLFLILSVLSLIQSYTQPFLIACCAILAILVIYAIYGWSNSPAPEATSPKSKLWPCVTAVAAIGFFVLVTVWTVCRVYSFCTPTYDFGIFSQMFYNMKQSGLPLTTVERDGLLSHFKVHVSPIYYLLLPFYCLFPTPATLQVLQAAVLASAVIPLWLLAGKHGLSPKFRTALCVLLLLYPAYAGGASYDIHENAFLTPLILWLLYALDTNRRLLTWLFAALVLFVKEDAAVYVAVTALYVIVRALVTKEYKKQLYTGILLFAVSVLWFLGVTTYLSMVGDGVMTYRYKNFMIDNSGSLLSVVKAVLLCPMKAVYECVDPEKLTFIGQTLLPLLFLPVLTRKYQRYILLIPYVLINLMSDYQYQHSIFFQYTYGSTAFLFYLTAVNLADIKQNWKKIGAVSIAAAFALAMFCSLIIPEVSAYHKRYTQNRLYYQKVSETLDTVPEGASVAATTFYTTYLSQREVLYDIRYATREHILSCEYIVMSATSENCYKAFAVNGTGGFENFLSFLRDNGYVPYSQLEGSVVIYRRI